MRYERTMDRIGGREIETVRKSADETLQVVNRPAAFGLPEETVKELAEITKNGFGSDMKYEDAKHHVLSGDVLHLFRRGGGLIGFASYNLYEAGNLSVLYLSGVVVKRGSQGNGFCSFSLELERDGMPYTDYLAMRTQSPVMYGIAARYGGRTFPSLTRSEPPEQAVSVGLFIAGKLGMKNYEPKGFVERGTYGRALYNEAPRSGNQEINRFFDRELNLDIRRWRLCNRRDGDATPNPDRGSGVHGAQVRPLICAG